MWGRRTCQTARSAGADGADGGRLIDRMPFKLKLNKSRQYNVVSKSLFVISIELLDGVVVECTLGSDSLGQECLENVCQRLVINQPELFGLRYASRQRGPRWLDLDRPLKRQLDKHAASNQLWLRVMYYVTAGTAAVTDEMSRYHYFLQLKNDLSEGKIACDCRQAVVLASYARQAEYGNHDAERHTVDYLKNLLSFPKLIREGGQIVERSRLIDGQLEYLTAAVIQHHTTLYNLPQVMFSFYLLTKKFTIHLLFSVTSKIVILCPPLFFLFSRYSTNITFVSPSQSIVDPLDARCG